MTKVLSSIQQGGVFYERVLHPEDFLMDGHHFHNEYEVYYLCSGARQYFIKDHTHPIEAGSLVFISSRIIHKTSPATRDEHERILLNIRPEVFAGWRASFPRLELSPLTARPYLIVNLNEEERPAIEAILQEIEINLADNAPATQTLASLKLMELMLFLLRSCGQHTAPEAHTATSSKAQKVDAVTQYILKQDCNVTLEDICRDMYISKFYLCRIFKEVCGMTIKEYINSNKILRAQELLEYTSHNVTTVAQLAGYENLTYFERVFKSFTGLTPLGYRKRHKKADTYFATVEPFPTHKSN